MKLTRVAAFAVALMVWSTVAQAQPVKPRVGLEYPYLLAGQKNEVFLLIDFEIAEADPAAVAARPPVNLALVIDRSGSMEDRGKIGYAREAASRLVDGLAATDRIAVVEYDDMVTVLWPAGLVKSKATIKQRIRRLTPRGSTNLTGGMLEGVAEVKKGLNGHQQLSRVVLLSDGLANQGITNPFRIKELVRQAKQQGVRITTMGLGLDYNEDLMQVIAEHGGGNYYYIEHPNQAVRVFQEEMKILYASVAKDVRVEFEAAGLVEKVEAFGYPSVTDGRITRISQEDIYAGEKRALLLKLSLGSVVAGDQKLGEVRVTYRDLVAKKPRTLESSAVATFTADGAEVERRMDERVAAEAALIHAAQEYRAAVKLFEQGDKRAAQSQIAATARVLGDKNSRLKDVRLKKKLDALNMEAAEMKEAERNAASRSTYLKKGKMRSFKGTKGKHTSYVMQEGSRGYDVERLQKALRDRKLYSGPIDGTYSAAVAAAVSAFQDREGMEVDGVAGPLTLKALRLY